MLFDIGSYHFPHYSKKQITWYKWCIIIILLAGIFFRLFHFFNNRSLWEDEVYLSAGVVNFSFKQLITQALPHLQKAPLGYLLVAKTCVMLFGKHEMALRLYSLICGLISLVLFLRICQNFLKPLGVIVALALFAFAPPLVYHTVEAKPYGTELLATLMILWWFVRYQDTSDIKELLLIGIYGAILVWFAFTAIFILFGVALTMALTRIRKGNWMQVWILAIPVTMWVISFGVNYFLFARQGSNTGWLIDFWNKHDGYMPLTPFAAGKWLLHALFSFFNYPLGLSWFNDWHVHSISIQLLQRMALVSLIPVIVGFIYLFKEHQRILLLISSIFLVALLASAAKQYPFHERLTVYLSPLVIILIAAGCQASIWRKWPLKVLQYAIIFLLVFGPLKNSVAQTVNTGLFGDYKKSYQREALLYLNNNYQPGDLVYVYWNDLPGYNLYKVMYDLKYTGIQGRDARHKATSFADYFSQVDRELSQDELTGRKRVWIIYNEHIDIPVGDYIGDPAWYYKDNDGIARFKQHLNQNGALLQSFTLNDKDVTSDINVSLYDLSGK